MSKQQKGALPVGVVRVKLSESVEVLCNKRGDCNVCGEEIVYAYNYGMWFHRGYLHGKRYAHQGKPRRAT